MASILYSVGYRAHCGAIVAVFFSGLSMPKTVQAQGNFIIASLTSISTFPRVLCCRHSPTLLSGTLVTVDGSFSKM